MSYIDTIKHEFLGSINGLPIYHPIEFTSKRDWGDYDFGCSPKNLVLGGGSGEHPALVIHHLGNLAASYVFHAMEMESHSALNAPHGYTAEMRERIIDLAFKNERRLEFCGWSMKNFRDFYDLSASPLNDTPRLEPQWAEEWLELSLGEFIYFSLPELNDLRTEIDAVLKDGNWTPGYWMKNVSCPPPNYIKSKSQSSQGSGFREHGYFRWDYVYPPRE